MPVNDIYSLLRYEEGERLRVYDDFSGQNISVGSRVLGHPSIGVGRSLDREGISQDESDAMLVHDVQKWGMGLSQHPWYLALDKIRQAALISMAHVLGLAGILTFSDMIAGLSVQDWQRAYDGVLASKWSSEEPARAKRVANMLLSGAWPSTSP